MHRNYENPLRFSMLGLNLCSVYLSGCCFRKSIYKCHKMRFLVASDLATDKFDNLLFAYCLSRFQHADEFDTFTPLWMRHTNGNGFGNAGMG